VRAVSRKGSPLRLCGPPPTRNAQQVPKRRPKPVVFQATAPSPARAGPGSRHTHECVVLLRGQSAQRRRIRGAVESQKREADTNDHEKGPGCLGDHIEELDVSTAYPPGYTGAPRVPLSVAIKNRENGSCFLLLFWHACEVTRPEKTDPGQGGYKNIRVEASALLCRCT